LHLRPVVPASEPLVDWLIEPSSMEDHRALRQPKASSDFTSTQALR
jgi:hypothetical protein